MIKDMYLVDVLAIIFHFHFMEWNFFIYKLIFFLSKYWQL